MIETLLTIAILACAAIFIRSFIRMTPSDFADATPRLSPELFFAGPTRGWGLFEDRFGRVRHQFTFETSGQAKGESLNLSWDFAYDDGETSNREWTLTREGDGRYRATASDMIGPAIGRGDGNALNWRYSRKIRLFGLTVRVDLDDWMFLQPGGVLINHIRMSKWGVTVGRISQVMTAEF